MILNFVELNRDLNRVKDYLGGIYNTIGIFLSGILALLVPQVLIGGCPSPHMDCRKSTFPAITVVSIFLLIGMALNGLYRARNEPPRGKPRAIFSFTFV
jgi:hypothetical protein